MIGIDLGSNTLRVVKIDDSTRQKVAVFEAIVGTAREMGDEKRVTPEAMKRVCDAISEAQKRIDFHDTIYAVTTQAVRMATNQTDVINQIYHRTGIEFHVISGEEEAQLTLDGVVHRLSLLEKKSDKFYLIDIGGGSTEIVVWDGEKSHSKSFPVGIVTAEERVGVIEEGCVDDICSSLISYIDELVNTYGILDVISTAGTATTIAALKEGMNYQTYDGEKINGVIINLTDIDDVKVTLTQCSDVLRSTLVGIGREKLVGVGIEILTSLLTALKVDQCCVIDDGLREGAAYQALLKLELRKN